MPLPGLVSLCQVFCSVPDAPKGCTPLIKTHLRSLKTLEPTTDLLASLYEEHLEQEKKRRRIKKNKKVFWCKKKKVQLI